MQNIAKRKAYFLYIITALFLFFEMALQVSPSVMSNQLMHSLNIGAYGLGIMSGCYFYTYAAMQIPSGILLDRFNPRVIVVISILVCVTGNALLAMADNFYFGCLARLLMGLGSAFAFVSVLVVTKDLFPNKLFATMTGVTQMLAALGAMSGQLPISLLVHSVGWRETLLMFSGIGVVLAIAIAIFLNYQRQALDVCYGKKNDCSIGCVKQIFRNRQTWWVALYALLLWAPMSGFASLWGVPFLTKLDNLSNSSAAFVSSLMWLGLALASPLLGYVSTKINNRRTPLAVSALLGMIAFALMVSFKLPAAVLGILLFIAGAACAGQALSFSVVKENNNGKVVATAIAINNMAVVISGAIIQPLIGWIVQHAGYSESVSMRIGMGIILTAFFVGFLIASFAIKDPLRRS